MIRIRLHHLMCILRWQGYGYNRAFTENFNRVVVALRENDTFELVDSADDICAVCPYLRGDHCARKKGADPTMPDARVRTYLDIQPGVHNFKEIEKSVAGKIAQKGLAAVCRGCSWLESGYCF